MKFIKIPSLVIAVLSAFAISAQADQASRLNINTATAEQIDNTLVFVGERTAKAIVEYRSKNGQFQTLDDLAKVKGLSKRLAKYNRSRISFQ